MSQLVDGFTNVLGSLSEAYSEVVTANNTSASPAVHDQTAPAVEATGAPVTSNQSAITWLSAHWMLILLALIALVVLVPLIKWVLK